MMKIRNGKGFTLIELLVVVLIIGILASVALPQYQAAVAKSRLSTVMSQVKTLKQVAEVFYMANGYYPNDTWESLDFDWPGCTMIGAGICRKGNVVLDLFSQGNGGRIDVAGYTLNGNDVINSYGMYLDNSPQKGQIYCGARDNDEIANKVCKSLGGSTYVKGNCTVAGNLGYKTCNIYNLP